MCIDVDSELEIPQADITSFTCGQSVNMIQKK